MKSEGEVIFVQCQNCGNIERINGKYDLDEIFIDNVCPCCGHTTELLLGKSELDIYEFMNVNVDYRYYTY